MQNHDPLREYLILDPEPEPAFDELAMLAAQICGASSALISLVSKDGHWFKSKVALPIADSARALGLCMQVEQSGQMVIPDLRADARCAAWWSESPAPQMRFFAGVPLAMPHSRTIGALAVIDTQPRMLNPAQQEGLATVARQVLNQLELRRILAELARAMGDRHRIEQALVDSEERYRELFENANDIVYTHDLEGNFTSLNAAGERITGWSREQVLKMNIRDVLAPEYLDLARRMIALKVAGEPPRIYKVDICDPQGKRVALELSTRLIKKDGKPIGIQGLARDVSDRRRAEEALQTVNEKLTHWVRELERRNHEGKLLNEMGELLHACSNTEEACTVVARAAGQLFPQSAGALFTLAADKNVYLADAAWGDFAGERIFTAEECWALRRGRTHWLEESATRGGPRCRHLAAASTGISICVPMIAHGEALGVFHLQRVVLQNDPQMPQVNPAEALQQLVESVAEHIASSLANIRLRETLRYQSHRDPLTALFNRRYMESTLNRELLRAARRQRPLGVIMLDVDHFKQLNDRYGHSAGDTLLRELGSFLQHNTRGDDIACRYGGEEFTLVLPEATLEITRQRAEQIRASVSGLNIRDEGAVLGPITVSLGVAAFPDHAADPAGLLKAADEALYRAKASGRNCVVVAPPLSA
jgi:diguanylate cyclase (GGDEF)-like protein/PAS domain S-box-containing protein